MMNTLTCRTHHSKLDNAYANATLTDGRFTGANVGVTSGSTNLRIPSLDDLDGVIGALQDVRAAVAKDLGLEL